jgi:hypothetical protein
MDATMQGALYRNRRRRLSRVILGKLTRWSTGLTVTEGDYVSSENGTSAWVAQNSGVSGATAPTGTGSQSDGVITWLKVDVQSLLQFLNTSPPTP